MDTRSSRTDLELLQAIKHNGCNDSFCELKNRHGPLSIRVYKRYSRVLNTHNYYFADFQQDMPIIFIKAIHSYDPAKPCKFSTWLGNQTRYFCLGLLNRGQTNEVSIEENVEILDSQTVEQKKHEILDFSFIILDKLKDKRIKKIFSLKYLNPEMTWRQIADKLNTSSTTVIKLHGQGLNLLRSKLVSKLEYDGV